MDEIRQLKKILALIVTGATVVVALAEIWNKIGPEVTKAVKPFVDDCRKLAPRVQEDIRVVTSK